MGIKLSAIKRLGNGPVTSWLSCEYFPGVSFLVTFATGEDTKKLYGKTDAAGEPRDPTDDEFRAWHLERITDWRGIDGDDDQPAAFDRSAVGDIWDADVRFRAWLIGGCRDLASFLGSVDAAVAVAVGSGG